jgi:chromosomal replication initiator protein
MARQIVMYLARELMDDSFPCIGRMMGGRDHSTIIHGHKLIAKRMAAQPEFRKTVRDIAQMVTGESRTDELMWERRVNYSAEA